MKRGASNAGRGSRGRSAREARNRDSLARRVEARRHVDDARARSFRIELGRLELGGRPALSCPTGPSTPRERGRREPGDRGAAPPSARSSRPGSVITGASHAPDRTTRYRRGEPIVARPRRRLACDPRRASPLADGSSRSRGAAESLSGGGGRLPAATPASPQLERDAGRIGVDRFRCLRACFGACPGPRYRDGNGRNGAYLRREGGSGGFRHKRAHQRMVGRANAKVSAAVVDARRKDERPRPEIQPVRMGRQRQVVAVQHGGTLTFARVAGGLLGVRRDGVSERTGRFLDVQCFSSSLGSVSLPGSRRDRTRVRPIRKSNRFWEIESG